MAPLYASAINRSKSSMAGSSSARCPMLSSIVMPNMACAVTSAKYAACRPDCRDRTRSSTRRCAMVMAHAITSPSDCARHVRTPFAIRISASCAISAARSSASGERWTLANAYRLIGAWRRMSSLSNATSAASPTPRATDTSGMKVAVTCDSRAGVAILDVTAREIDVPEVADARKPSAETGGRVVSIVPHCRRTDAIRRHQS